MPVTGATVKWIGKREFDAKLLAAAPHILENNWEMVTAMLDGAKAELESTTPFGPAHFGYHLRDSYTTEVANKGWRVTGKLMSPPQGYWREFGTRGRSRKQASALGLSVGQLNKAVKLGGLGGGEKATMAAHKAVAGFRRLIKEFYSHHIWWRL